MRHHPVLGLHPIRWGCFLAAVACGPSASPVETEVVPDDGVAAPSACVASQPGVFVDGSWYSPSLQAALDDAPAGAVVAVCGGVWLGPFSAPRAVILQGAGSGVTILEGYNPGTVMTVAPGSTVRGLTIRGGHDAPEGGGLRLDGPGVYSVEDSVIEGNGARIGGGIATGTGATVTIDGTTVRDNSADTGGGISVGPGSAVHLVDTEVRSNRAALEGGGIALDNGSLIGGDLVANEITDSATTIGGAGLSTVGDCTVQGTTVAENQATNGPGISVRSGTVALSDLSVTDNQGPLAAGGGLTCVEATVTLGGTVISRNLAEEGGGLWARSCTVTGGSIFDNESVGDGGGVVLITSTLAGATVSGNIAGGYPSGIWLADRAELVDTVVEGHGGEWGAVEAGPDSRVADSTIVDNATCAVLVSGQVALERSTLKRNDAGACLVGGFNPTASLASIASDWGTDADDNTIDLSWSGSEYGGYGANATFTCAEGCLPAE